MRHDRGVRPGHPLEDGLLVAWREPEPDDPSRRSRRGLLLLLLLRRWGERPDGRRDGRRGRR